MAEPSRRFVILGNNGSPYSCKIRSYLRFKRFPFDWTSHGFQGWPQKYKDIRPKVIPVVEFPSGFAMNESTNIIQTIEKEFSSNRSVIPQNKCIAFIADLLEDFADEWVTKLMFAMRWNRKIDQDFGSLYIVQHIPSTMRKTIANTLKKRQMVRCALVGCDNDQEMHQSLHEICGIFEKYLTSQNNTFLFGKQPTNADFAFYGQMTQFRVDMTPNRILRGQYPYVYSWLDKMDDLSGIEVNNEIQIGLELTSIVKDLLSVCGNIYLPFLKGNALSLMEGKESFSVNVKINGNVITHKQAPFKWQRKCLNVLQTKLNALRTEKDFDKLKHILMQTGCWNVLNAEEHSKL